MFLCPVKLDHSNYLSIMAAIQRSQVSVGFLLGGENIQFSQIARTRSVNNCV